MDHGVAVTYRFVCSVPRKVSGTPTNWSFVDKWKSKAFSRTVTRSLSESKFLFQSSQSAVEGRLLYLQLGVLRDMEAHRHPTSLKSFVDNPVPIWLGIQSVTAEIIR